MKKIVFAAQVFGLTALLSMAVIPNINPPAGAPSENNSLLGVIKKIEKISIHLSGRVKDKIEEIRATYLSQGDSTINISDIIQVELQMKRATVKFQKNNQSQFQVIRHRINGRLIHLLKNFKK